LWQYRSQFETTAGAEMDRDYKTFQADEDLLEAQDQYDHDCDLADTYNDIVDGDA
jgi:hypothetical protein